MLHAGIYHILGNICVQFLVLGHLESTWGIAVFSVIYFSSGVIGYMFSCCFLYDSISVGSSGSIMGILTAWLIHIIFRIRTMQSEHDFNITVDSNISNHSTITESRGQIIIFFAVFAAIFLTLALSFKANVDWGSHCGGSFYGFLWGCFLFSHHPKKESILVRSVIHDSTLDLKQPVVTKVIRTVSAALLFCTPIFLLVCMNTL